MPGRFDGRVAIVSGAGRGIGKAIATRLAAEGASVLLFSRTESELQTVAAEIEASGGAVHYVVADASKEDDVVRAVAAAEEKFGAPADIFIANAGWYPFIKLDDVTLDQWNEIIAVNLTSAFLAVKAVTPGIVKAGKGGRIVLISSISGPRTGLSGYAPYTAAKAGLQGFVKTAAVELAKHKISINTVLPGNIYTEALASLPNGYVEETVKAIPAGTLGDVSDIAEAVAYLVAAGPFTTGAEIVVDGAQSLPESHFAEF
ncbi:3-oxoacyl-[acyl-carrier-protein] reductase [Monoraphidium neglectum]|uniref:3-oxoacyl-[acyl-carrier-protein] reductase n=1 Tax=Monoraphidium neglectum TaxID=145388 RepID=A0A0D2MTM1_9CHLO|nr:3-oxoacyl-[acyl-carrier-protein] reductase [Monoraphidium neglectum]KIY97780.1 3-oxoacyl-[acyl-carrier-protein] reductase [Monoraphidium neglectum]|eukprot:XP_013896800.1 3-oxoacyl-[acyl-carrier-protein] reductase [Monoraphidium neglectum]